MRASKVRWVRGALRGLQDPVRTLAQAVADITANLEGEFDAPATSHLRRAEIAERLVLLRTVVTTTRASAAALPAQAPAHTGQCACRSMCRARAVGGHHLGL